MKTAEAYYSPRSAAPPPTRVIIVSHRFDELRRLVPARRSRAVKTTGPGKFFPFYVSANEVRVSEQEQPRFYLYRLFRFSEAPRLYTLQARSRRSVDWTRCSILRVCGERAG
jgi:hypothetical protein